jgi:acetyltransferase-like isoleucine patch superfamily enzyme
MEAVFLPILDANMTHGRILAWHKREGEAVRAGETLFEVETDKINAEVEAEVSGIVHHIVVPEGEKVRVLALLAFIGAEGEALPPRNAWSALSPAAGAGEAPVTAAVHAAEPEPPIVPDEGRVAASPAARRLARERGISLAEVSPTGARGEVTRADVDAVAARFATAAPAAGRDGAVDPAFLALVRRDLDAFRHLSSEAKVKLYTEHGAHIGAGVRIERGAVILAERLELGALAVVGADSTLECSHLRLGRLSVLGRRTRLKCRSVEIGDALWAKDDIVIGGGGADEPGARLQAGDACFFGEACYLNTGEPIVLGDEVCIGSRAMLFTHSHWQSILRGYLSRFGPITVGDHVFIGNNAFVFPGVEIGAGATVMVNSFVAVRVHAGAFVAGVPAQVVRQTVEPERAEQSEILRRELRTLAPTLAAHGFPATLREEGDAVVLDVDGATIRFQPEASGWREAGGRRVIVLAFGGADERDLAPGVTLFDLAAGRVVGPQDALSDEVREFCRRRGIRFRPYAWRYGAGHFEGDEFRRR